MSHFLLTCVTICHINVIMKTPTPDQVEGFLLGMKYAISIFQENKNLSTDEARNEVIKEFMDLRLYNLLWLGSEVPTTARPRFQSKRHNHLRVIQGGLS